MFFVVLYFVIYGKIYNKKSILKMVKTTSIVIGDAFTDKSKVSFKDILRLWEIELNNNFTIWKL